MAPDTRRHGRRPARRRRRLGVPPTDTRRDGNISLEQAYGNDKTAQGAAVWVGATKAELRLFAVVCHVAGRITAGLGHSWGRRGTRVYVAEAEAEDIGLLT